MSRTRGAWVPGGWRVGEVWLDADELDWFGELEAARQEAGPLQPLLFPAPAVAAPGGFPAPEPAPFAPRRPRPAIRLVPAAAAAAAVGLGIPLLLQWRAAQPEALAPSASPPPPVVPTVRDTSAEPAAPAAIPFRPPAETAAAEAAAEAERVFPDIRWRASRALGVPHAGRLVDGVRLPQEGPGWVTWDPALDRTPNRPNRLWGTDELIRITLNVIASYRLAHPDAPPLVIGDLSRRGGGELDEHASHENGLDIDVYYPRRDGRPLPPSHPGQVDLRLAQDIVDRFLKAGAQIMFVGYSVPLRGPSGVVVPYPNHDNHVHVRIAPPRRS